MWQVFEALRNPSFSGLLRIEAVIARTTEIKTSQPGRCANRPLVFRRMIFTRVCLVCSETLGEACVQIVPTICSLCVKH